MRPLPAVFSVVPTSRLLSPGPLLAALLGVLIPAEALAHGGLHERISTLSAEIAERPDDAQPRMQLAAVYCEHDEWANALAEITQVEALAPGKYPTSVLRGQCLTGLGRLEEGLAELEAFLRSAPDHGRARLYRARALTKLKRPGEALTDYQRAWRNLAEVDADIAREVADALVTNGRQKEALQILNEAIGRIGPVPSLLTRALELEVAAGFFDAALARVEALKAQDVRPELWIARRAEVLERAERRVEARAAWEALLTRIESLPNLERGSLAVRRLEEQARAALRAPLVATPDARSGSR